MEDLGVSPWWGIIGTVVASLVTGFSTWFFTKRKYNSEVDNNLIKNMQESLDFYKSLADDNKARLEAVLDENNDLRKEVTDLREQVSRLTSVLAEYGLQKLLDNKNNE